MYKLALSICLLFLSNVVMTFAWYGFLRKPGESSSSPMWQLILMSWGLALLEYCFMVPANQLGRAYGLSLAQLKIMQEVISLSVFSLYAIFYAREHLSWNYLWAGLCILGAVFFIFRR